MDRLRVLHLNDSKSALGSKVDRHAHIGEGEIGTEAFKRIVRHPALRKLPGIIELPHGEDDPDDLALLRSLTN
jgi:deoxyribonuclease-4